MFEIFNYPQVMTICLISMFLLPLIFYLASKPGKKKPAYFASHTSNKRSKPLKSASLKKGKALTTGKAKKSKGKSASPEKETDEDAENTPDNDDDEVIESKREKKNSDDDPEPRRED